jgi:hypothetical protein
LPTARLLALICAVSPLSSGRLPTLALVCLTACGGAGRPAQKSPTVRVEPIDLTSRWTGPIKVILNNSDRPVGQLLLEQIARGISIVEWPAQANPVTVEVRISDSTGGMVGPGGHPQPDPAVIQLGTLTEGPLSAVPEGWHLVRLAPLPKPFIWQQNAATVDLPDGSRGIRFNRASAPVPTAMSVCDKVTEDFIYLSFSEPVLVHDGQIALGNTMVTCSLEPTPRPSQTIRFRCPVHFLEGAPIRISFSPGVQGETGVPLTVTNDTESFSKDQFAWADCPFVRF